MFSLTKHRKGLLVLNFCLLLVNSARWKALLYCAHGPKRAIPGFWKKIKNFWKSLDKLSAVCYTEKTARLDRGRAVHKPNKKPLTQGGGGQTARAIRGWRSCTARDCTPLRLLSESEGRLDLPLRFSHLDEFCVAVQNCACLLIGDAEGFLNLSASHCAVFSDVLSNLFSEFSVCDLCLARLVGLVTLALVKQFKLVSAESYDFRIVGAYSHNLVQHFSLCHNHHLLPFLSLCDFIVHLFSQDVKPLFKDFLFFFTPILFLLETKQIDGCWFSGCLSFFWYTLIIASFGYLSRVFFFIFFRGGM